MEDYSVILNGDNLNSAGPSDYHIQIEAVGGCVVTLVTATEIHCESDFSATTEVDGANIQVGYG